MTFVNEILKNRGRKEDKCKEFYFPSSLQQKENSNFLSNYFQFPLYFPFSFVLKFLSNINDAVLSCCCISYNMLLSG